MVCCPGFSGTPLAKDKFTKGIGNRTTAGSGATWGADEPAPRPMSEENTPDMPRDRGEQPPAPRRELRPPVETPTPTPPVPAVKEPAGPGVADQLTVLLSQIGDFVLDAGRFLMTRVIRPSKSVLSRKWKVIREKIGMEDRLVDGDTYVPDRARDWEKFKKGKRSSSYLQDDDIDKK